MFLLCKTITKFIMNFSVFKLAIFLPCKLSCVVLNITLICEKSVNEFLVSFILSSVVRWGSV